jgi:hypothetical protein
MTAVLLGREQPWNEADSRDSRASAFSLLVYTGQTGLGVAFHQEKPHLATLACAE